VVSHGEVLEIGRQKADLVKQLVAKIVELIPSGV
jgi:hypothetical protein